MIEFESLVSGSESESERKTLSSIGIKVLGVGGGAGNILSRLSHLNTGESEFLLVNSNGKELNSCKIKKKIQVGQKITGGWGTGGDPEVGRKIILAERDKIRELLAGTDVLFLVSSLGKGMGTGGTPVIAEVAREIGCLVIGFFTLPFRFEGNRRVKQAREGLTKLKQTVDALMVVPNDLLLNARGKEALSLKEDIQKIDEVLKTAIIGFRNILFNPGLINLDFADFKAFLQQGSPIQISTGKGKGEKAPQEAVSQALNFPLGGKINLQGVEKVLMAMKGGSRLSLSQVEKTVLLIKESISATADITFGVYLDEKLSDELSLTLMMMGQDIAWQPSEDKDKESYQEEMDFSVYDRDNLDIPTFLRKRNN